MQARRTARAARTGHVIEGSAVVVERISVAPQKVLRPAQPAPINDNARADLPFARPRPMGPDLLFQGAARGYARPKAPRPEASATARPAGLSDEAGRRQASVGVAVALVATLAAWTVPDLPKPAPHSTQAAPSATTAAGAAPAAPGRGDRITIRK
ncbi:hypothetical protein GCM10011390_35680 [Aureimonas endophytica]|uniref:Uncharacterized protein n=1 Tax=Aureimonas endophytica TaxID=2027858 RepID=A0A916ZUI5_9HYPH|nr:hypothetical protein [Aureimonas endophytica]GGE13449.1 hypothetical protein GCM10011390_35680 [Aureimonas endophytica]